MASRIIGVIVGNESANVAVTWPHCSATSSGSVWAKIVFTAAVTAGACEEATAACRLRIKCTRHRCHEAPTNCCATAAFTPA